MTKFRKLKKTRKHKSKKSDVKCKNNTRKRKTKIKKHKKHKTHKQKISRLKCKKIKNKKSSKTRKNSKLRKGGMEQDYRYWDGEDEYDEEVYGDGEEYEGEFSEYEGEEGICADKLRRLIICHGSEDPEIKDDNWRNAETLDYDSSKRASYTTSINEIWPARLNDIGQFDEIMLKNCNIYTLLDNLPYDKDYEPSLYPTEEDIKREEAFYASCKGTVDDLKLNYVAWYNISQLLKNGGKLYDNLPIYEKINYYSTSEDPDFVAELNAITELSGSWFEEEDEEEIGINYDGESDLFAVYTKHES